MSKTPIQRIGQIIADEMHAQGLSENEAALRSGISRQTLRRRLASGEFNVTELSKVADVLGCTSADLLARAEQAVA